VRLGVDAGRALHGRGGVATYTRELIRSLVGSPRVDEVVLFDLDRGWSKREAFECELGPLPAKVAVAPLVRSELEGLNLFHAPGYAMPPVGAPRHVFTLHDLTVLSHPHCHTLDNRVRSLASVSEALFRGPGQGRHHPRGFQSHQRRGGSPARSAVRFGRGRAADAQPDLPSGR